MGAYLVGSRGGGLHAIALGLSVTVSHTLGILVLAAIVVGLRGMVSPEAFNRVAPVASGVLVLGIGAALLAGQLRSRRDATTTHRVGAHPHGDVNEPATGHPHPHGHEPTLPSEDESHGRVEPSIGWRSLFALGLAGGIIPSTNALIILLASVATGRAVYGLVLVIAFGLGMAVVLAGVGLGLVFARDRMGRLPALPGLGRAAGLAPLMAGVIVVSLGIYLTGQAVGVGPTL
jgi:ABC-type nickel/cobalt efflux system permease component RcnA